jgi:hypothetical protein
MCDRSKIPFERQRRIEIFGASGQLRCGSDVHLERHQLTFTAAGWIHPFNLCATAAISKNMFLFKGLIPERSSKFRTAFAV